MVLTGTPVQNDLMVRRGYQPQAPAACDQTQHAAQRPFMCAWLASPPAPPSLPACPELPPPIPTAPACCRSFTRCCLLQRPASWARWGPSSACTQVCAAVVLQSPACSHARGACCPQGCAPPLTGCPHCHPANRQIPCALLTPVQTPSPARATRTRRLQRRSWARRARREGQRCPSSVAVWRVCSPHAHLRLACPQRGSSCPSTSPRHPLPRFPHLAASCSSRRAPLSCGAPRTS